MICPSGKAKKKCVPPPPVLASSVSDKRASRPILRNGNSLRGIKPKRRMRSRWEWEWHLAVDRTPGSRKPIRLAAPLKWRPGTVVDQCPNRLAHQYSLRKLNDVPSTLVFLYFVNADDMHGPMSEEEWHGAVRLIHAALGLPKELEWGARGSNGHRRRYPEQDPGPVFFSQRRVGKQYSQFEHDILSTTTSLRIRSSRLESRLGFAIASASPPMDRSRANVR
jgi:hypothetical protein